MKREIKFRGKQTYGNRWVYGYLIRFGVENRIYHGLENDYAIVVGQSVGQLTGLKDKNGVEIYEGDIISTKQGVATVIWSDAAFALFSEGSEAIDWEHSSVYESSEVIGNIYENTN